MKANKSKATPLITFQFPNGSTNGMPLAQYLRMLLDQAYRLASSDNYRMSEMGEAAIDRFVQQLAAYTMAAQTHKKSTAAAAAARRKIGDTTANRVRKGQNPAVGKRQQQRIKARAKLLSLEQRRADLARLEAIGRAYDK